METIRKINDELAIAGQISSEQLPQLVGDGFRSILNLRSPGEYEFEPSEEVKAGLFGLNYLNFPLSFDNLHEETILQTFKLINELGKPLLVHCDTGIRAALLVLIYITMQQGATPKQAFRQAERLGLLTPVCQE
ncbi:MULTISPECIES: sulfur transferase domain-containing protein [unclassified Leptolyngbya]|uniref:beta-lactamase hydrolase domain-containing protein n=1 Tax=unclassified Leptolyngbya TaxID=2650499 RepID=UPI001684350E|nr:MULTISPECIES: sulfur transferase domain-containing protein [unclassified Leptolyngbya]MBD1911611.1 hypothetical protein [Leptolyngbya sp. FACHB-8]MBD2155216.1 hypothetical protein [Leptolyngbya sp. FACHB-16]